MLSMGSMMVHLMVTVTQRARTLISEESTRLPGIEEFGAKYCLPLSYSTPTL